MTDDTEQPVNGRDFHTDKRQIARLPNLHHEKSASIVAWDPRLALDIVLQGVDKAMEVFTKYKIDQPAAMELLQNPVFQKQLKDYAAEIETSGMSYRMKARILAEDLLPHAYDLATDTLYPAAVRADMIQWMTKVADLEPAKANGKDVPQTGGFSLQILFAGQAPGSAAVVAHDMAGQSAVGAREAITIEQRGDA